MINETELEKYMTGDILDLQYKLDEVGSDIKILAKAKHKKEATEKMYEALQLYSIKFMRINPPFVDKQQINILIKLYRHGEKKYSLKKYEIPKFDWIK